ncbi:acetylornithine deacetylase [Mesorhizobium sp. A556]
MTKEIQDVLNNLISFNTVSSLSNMSAVNYISNYLGRYTKNIRIIPDSVENKASILASFGPIDRPGVVLSGHTDVVPVDGQQWSSDPFDATFRNGRIYGRGATDMKGFVAVAVAHAKKFASAATALPIHIALSYDEELGCKGAPPLVRQVASLAGRQHLCIVGEPTSMIVVRGHKGKVARRIEIRGKGGHSSLPHKGANAAVAAAKIAVALDEIAKELKTQKSSEPFDPPWSTLHIGCLHSGTALNLIPDRAEVAFEIRSVPETAVESVLDRIEDRVAEIRRELQGCAEEADIVVHATAAYPGLAIDARDEAVRMATRLAGSNAVPEIVSFGTEAGLFQAAGIPTVVCGPGHISRAHKPDEWIGIDELESAARMMERIAQLASKGWEALRR